MPKTPDISQPLYRTFELRRDAVDVEARTAELAFSSEAPVERWFGAEILDHKRGSVRMDRLRDGAPLLVGHDTADQVGVVDAARLDADKVGRATVRFSRSVRGQEIFQDVQDGIRRLVSVGYRVHSMKLEKSGDSGDVYRVTDWEPFEISIVPVPADASVGVGRSFPPTGEEPTMTETVAPETRAPAPAAAAPVAPITVTERGPDPLAAERDRVRQVVAIGKQWGMADDAERAIEAGTSADAFRDHVLAKLHERGALRPAESPDIGMSRREVAQYSFTRALLAASDPINAHTLAPFELEASRAAQDKRGDSRDKAREGALTVPVDVLRQSLAEQRDLVVGTPTAGGHLVATNLLSASFIDLLRNALVLPGMGATLLTDLNGNIAIPRQTGGATAYWVTEGNAPTESQQAVDQVAMTPKTVGAYTDYSRRLLLQSSTDVEAFVRNDIATTVALAIQQGAINGSGVSGQPTGILTTAGIGSVAGGTNGAAPTYAHMVALESALANVNAAVGNMAYLTNSKVRGKLRTTEEFPTTNGRPVWTSAGGMDGSVLGYRAVVTNSVPSNLTKGTASGVCSAIIIGNWSDLMIGLWGGLDLMVDPYALATSGGRRIIALQDLDIAVRHPESFAAMLDALTT